jgi:N utilization substance protein A
VQTIVTELKGEKIDIVNFSTDPQEFVANALSPAKVMAVYPKTNEKVAIVVVPDYQLSLAIGKEGQNARLAAKLTGWKIDIKSESQAVALNIIPQGQEEAYENYEEYGEYEEYSEYDEFAETNNYQEYEETGPEEIGLTPVNEQTGKGKTFPGYDLNEACQDNETYDEYAPNLEFSDNKTTETEHVTEKVNEKALIDIGEDLKTDDQVMLKEKKKKGKG